MASLAAFQPALGNSFVWDDVDILLTNAGIMTLDWPRLRWMFSTLYCTTYQPLGWLAYALIYRAAELRPLAYHAASLALHAACAAVFFLACRRLMEKAGARLAGWGAAAAALLFAVHPLQASTVAWATEIPDQGATLAFLLAVWVYLGGQARRRLWACGALFAVSLLFRWKGVALPAVLLALDVWPLRRFGRRAAAEKLPFFALAALAVFANALAKTASAHVPGPSFGTARGLLLFPWLVLWPKDLVALYSLTVPDTLEVPGGLAAALVLAVAAWAWTARRRWPAAPLALGFYAACVAPPLLNTQPGGTLFAFPHYSYLACLPFYALAGEGLRRLAAAGRAALAAALCAVLAAGLAVLARAQSRVWRDGVAFWTHTLTLDPGCRIAYGNLGSALINYGRYNDSWIYSTAQLAYNPSDSTAAANVAELRQRAPGLVPDLPAFWVARADDSLRLGLPRDALRLSAKALSRRPRWPEAHETMARALEALEQPARARRHREAAALWRAQSHAPRR